MSDSPGLFLNTERFAQHGPSGYARLVEFFPGAELIQFPRKDPQRIAGRLFNRLLRAGAATRYYRWGSFRCEWAARRVCRQRHPAFVHILWGDHDWGYLDKWLPPEVPLFATFHQPTSLLPEALCDPGRLHRLRHLILMAPEQKEFLAKYAGLPDDRMTFVPHGIDTNAFSPGGEKAATGERVRLLHVGSYLRNFALLEKLALALADDPLVELRVIAPPHVAEAFPGLRKARFESHLSAEDLVRAYRESDALLMTAAAATANNAVLEGLACGLPILFEENRAINDYVGPTAGRFVAKNDAPAFLALIGEFRGSPEMRTDMAKAARARALEFDWQNVAENMRRIYRS